MQGQEAGPPQPVRAGDPVVPDGYRLVEQRRVLGSVVRAAWNGPDGDELEWTSRGYRKGRQPRTRVAGSAAAAYRRPPLFGFAPHVLSWWVAVTFTIGSVFFVVGAAGAVTGPTRWWPNAMYFVGSLLVTTGASLQLRVGRVLDCSAAAPVCVGKRLVMRHLPINDVRCFACCGPAVAVDAVAGTLSAHLSLVTRVLSPFYHTDPGFTVAPGARVRVMKNGWPVKATLADVVVGDRVCAHGGVDRSDPAVQVLTIRWMTVRHVAAP